MFSKKVKGRASAVNSQAIANQVKQFAWTSDNVKVSNICLGEEKALCWDKDSNLSLSLSISTLCQLHGFHPFYCCVLYCSFINTCVGMCVCVCVCGEGGHVHGSCARAHSSFLYVEARG